MNKSNQEIFNKLITNLELAAHSDFIREVLEATKASEHPLIYGEDGEILQKWCLRHEQYEDYSEWTIPENGKVDASCDVAVKQWRALTKELKALEKDIPNHFEDPVDLQAFMIKVESKRAERAGKYRYPDNI